MWPQEGFIPHNGKAITGRPARLAHTPAFEAGRVSNSFSPTFCNNLDRMATVICCCHVGVGAAKGGPTDLVGGTDHGLQLVGMGPYCGYHLHT